MAVSSYLQDTAGGMVVAAETVDEASAVAAIELLRSSGVRAQDISVVARDEGLAERIAAARAWTPFRGSGRGLLRRLRPGRRLPADLRRRYGKAIRDGRIVLIVAADGQPPDTVAALFAQARAERIEQWWQAPAALFAPPELAGPF